MRLDFLTLDTLSVSKANMRHGRKAPDIADILPTVRRRGILQPLLVRPCADEAAENRFEIVAGRRRFAAAQAVHAERLAAGLPTGDAIPCAILDEIDDADAIEASLIENVARVDADEVTQWETFTRLIKEGRSVDDVAATFGLADIAVRRVLALGNLLPRIRAMYAAETIDAVTVRHLTMASKRQQQAWLALADDADADLPIGHRLKAWLFGGQSIPVANALFDVGASGLAIVADLFGDDRYFADADSFWTAQNAAIAARRAAYLAAGWSDAVIVPPTGHFAAWEYEKVGKRKGGRVYIDVRSTGEVVVHEGYVSRRDAARARRGGDDGAPAKPARPEITATMQTYLDLHRHAAVRAELLDHPQVALRLMLAHAIVGSTLWSVRPQSQTCRDEAVTESVETCPAEVLFDASRRAALARLGFDADTPSVVGGNADPYGLVGLFRRLLDLDDAAILATIAIVMGETLAAGSAAVEAVGLRLGTDMARHWRADDAFFELIRDRAVINAIVAEVAGAGVAEANAAETAKAQKAIVRDCLHGANGRVQIDGWVPRWMAFPPSAYTVRGGVGTLRASAIALAAMQDEADPIAPDDVGSAVAPTSVDNPEPAAPASRAEPIPLAA